MNLIFAIVLLCVRKVSANLQNNYYFLRSLWFLENENFALRAPEIANFVEFEHFKILKRAKSLHPIVQFKLYLIYKSYNQVLRKQGAIFRCVRLWPETSFIIYSTKRQRWTAFLVLRYRAPAFAVPGILGKRERKFYTGMQEGGMRRIRNANFSFQWRNIENLRTFT